MKRRIPKDIDTLQREVFIENSPYWQNSIKKKILDLNIIPYKCEICSVGPIWNEQPMTLVLDHVNGIHTDNRLSNLRFVCNNCDSQLDTYKARNIRKQRLSAI
jgi:hypothetical protein